MELRRYLLLLRQRLVLIVLCVVAGVAGGYLISNNTPIYQSQTSIYVGSRTPGGGDTSNDIITLDRIIATYAAMVKSSPVASGAIQASHAPRSPGQVVNETTAVVVVNTNLIDITVADTDPAVAQSLANGVAASFIAQVQNLSSNSGAAASSTPSVTVFQPASLPGTPLATSKKRNLALGALFGLIVSVGVVLLIDYLDISIKSGDDLEHHIDLPVLGTIPLGRPGTAGPIPLPS
jgi:capsular polysaccharide biosynthesis protein